MMTLSQRDLAHELGVTEMSVHRLKKAMFITETPLSDHAATMIVVAFELQKIGVNTSRACELISRFSSEIRYVAGGTDRRAWLVFVEEDKYDSIIPSIIGRHLEALVEAHPLCFVLPLHECVARAVERLATMKTRRSAA